ncbi:ATP-binding protein [Actinokineospora sp. NPDC004072]
MDYQESVVNAVGGRVVGAVVQAGTVRQVVLSSSDGWGVVPQQLPVAPAHFVGRAEELAALTTALDLASGRGGMISALAGAGGVGKTWLAVHWAYQHRDRFPDGQLFVDLQGFSPTGKPMEPSVAVRGFLDALGVAPGRVPADLHAQAALYRSLVAGKRMLIVLDNAASSAQVTPLLPGVPGCTVVTTSRRHLSGLISRYGARPIQLGVPTDGEAHHRLATQLGDQRVADEPHAMDDLVTCCGGFPLALGIVAGRAATSPHTPLSALAAELRDATTRLDALDSDDPTASLPAVLSWSAEALTADQRQVFALLGIAPGPEIGLLAASSLSNLSTARTRRILRALEEASLLEHDGHGRYRMHDLIRAYAITLNVDDEVRLAALRRVLDFYTHTAHTADRLLYPHRVPSQLGPPVAGAHPHPLLNSQAALEWFDSEHANLLAAQEIAATHMWHSTVRHLAWAMYVFHTRRGHLRSQLAAWRAALAATEHLTDPAPHIQTHRYIGRAYSSLGHHDNAIEHLTKALALAEQHSDPTHRIRTHRVLAWAWERYGDDRQALNHATCALHLVRPLDLPLWEASAFNAVGWYAARLGDVDTARIHCQAALALYQNHHDPTGEAAALDSLGFIAHRTGDHLSAISYYQQALALRSNHGDTYEAANTLDRLGHSQNVLGDHDQARTCWQEALELYQTQGREQAATRVEQQLNDLPAT